jgi:glucose/arabinose dehydrogenase
MNPSLRLLLLLALTLAGCSETARYTVDQGSGPSPVLPRPVRNLIPTLHVAEATGWPAGAAPQVAPGLRVTRFAENLDHPRWLYVLPDGGVLVAETNAPVRPDDGRGIKGKVMGVFMRKAGAGIPSANRITLLADRNADGVAEERSEFINGLNSPFGMALVDSNLYVANTDALLRFPYQAGQKQIAAMGTVVTVLPGGPLNHHWTKNVIASADGQKLFVTVGSNSNVGENGIDKESGRAAIWEVDAATGSHRIFASGLRNPNGMVWQPDSGALWVVVNERDELGSDLVPDYLTSVKEGGFYGWPYSYYGSNIDSRPRAQRPDLTSTALVPDYALGSHTASLGLVAARGPQLLSHFGEGMFVGQHGSWNRRPFSGYRVIFVPFKQGKPSGQPVEVLTGFVNAKEEARGRPVGLAIDSTGALLVADDVGDTIWRVSVEQ